MVHKYSALKLIERRERALRLGYIVAAPLGMRHVLVSDEIAPRLKAISASLSAHSHHNRLNGHGSHFARSAALLAAADKLISKPECDQALRTHRDANRAKHLWLPKAPHNNQTDPLLIHDPWSASSRPPPARGAPLASTSARASSLSSAPPSWRSAASDPWRNYKPIFEAQCIDVATIEAKCIDCETMTNNEAQCIDAATMTTTDRGTMTINEAQCIDAVTTTTNVDEELREPLYIDAATMTEIECIDRCTNTINEAQCIDAATMTSLDFEEKKKMSEVEAYFIGGDDEEVLDWIAEVPVQKQVQVPIITNQRKETVEEPVEKQQKAVGDKVEVSVQKQVQVPVPQVEIVEVEFVDPQVEIVDVNVEEFTTQQLPQVEIADEDVEVLVQIVEGPQKKKKKQKKRVRFQEEAEGWNPGPRVLAQMDAIIDAVIDRRFGPDA